MTGTRRILVVGLPLLAAVLGLCGWGIYRLGQRSPEVAADPGSSAQGVSTAAVRSLPSTDDHPGQIPVPLRDPVPVPAPTNPTGIALNPASGDISRAVAERVPTGQVPLEVSQAKTRQVQQLYIRRDRDGLKALLSDPVAGTWAAQALLKLGATDPSTVTLLTDQVRQGTIPANRRAMLLQQLMEDDLVDRGEWIRYALDQKDSTFRRVGFYAALNPKMGLPLVQAIPMVLPMLNDPDPGNREMLLSALQQATGMFDLGPNPAAWDAWWRREGEALFRVQQAQP